jgi:hypothetical protein
VVGSTAAILPASPRRRGAGENGPDKRAPFVSDDDVEQKARRARTR